MATRDKKTTAKKKSQRKKTTAKKKPQRKKAAAKEKPQPTLEDLVEAAIESRERAYAPYSRFRVGAALRTTSGGIIAGCNVENASYGLCVCAERTAIGTAVSQGMESFDALAVVSDASPPAPPCGQCLQTLAEFADDLDIVIANPQGERLRIRLSELLPFRFKPDMLGDGAEPG